MRKIFAFAESETGGIAAMAAFSMPIILSAAVLGAEGGAWALQHQKMQGAADTAALSGIILFGDRNMPQGTVFKLTGGGTQHWTGAIYLPRADLTFAGGTTGGNGCTQIVADTVTFTGNSNLSLSCAGVGTSTMGTQIALLVE